MLALFETPAGYVRSLLAAWLGELAKSDSLYEDFETIDKVLDALKRVDRNMFYNLSPKVFKEIRIIPDFKKFLCFNFNTSLYLTLDKKPDFRFLIKLINSMSQKQ